MQQVQDLISELNKFSPDIICMGSPITDNRIAEFEARLKVNLPEDFKAFLTHYNGMSLMGAEVYGIGPDLQECLGRLGLEDIYHREHYEVIVPQFEYLIPFSPDGGGNFYCFDSRHPKGDSMPVVFWVSNYPYSEDDPPGVTNESFVDFMRADVIEWTLEDYDYDGNERGEG